VHPLDYVTAVIEDTTNVLGVHSAGEVRVAVICPDLHDSHQKLIPDEELCSSDLRIFSSIWNTCIQIYRAHTLFSLQNLVYGLQKSAFHHRTKRSSATSPAVGGVVLSDHHVVAATGCHEDDFRKNCGFPTIKTLDPLSTINSNSLEVDFVHLESAHVHACVLCTCVVLLLSAVNQLIFIGTLEAGLHAIILPQLLSMLKEVLAHKHTITCSVCLLLAYTPVGSITPLDVSLGRSDAALLSARISWILAVFGQVTAVITLQSMYVTLE
uniref:Uncharacterized protein n=1 Tax=Oryzias melastigma TaxID=30732 RepID=A0A3B3BSV7_ORYME